MTKEEASEMFFAEAHPHGYTLLDVFIAGWETSVRSRDSDLKEAMKQAVREVMAEIKKLPTTGGDE